MARKMVHSYWTPENQWLALRCFPPAGHMAFSFLVLAPVALREPWEAHRRTLEKQWQGVVYIGAFMALNIALNNISLLDISLTLNQIIRCARGRAGVRMLLAFNNTGTLLHRNLLTAVATSCLPPVSPSLSAWQVCHPGGDLPAGHCCGVAVPQPAGTGSAHHADGRRHAVGVAGHSGGQALRHPLLLSRHVLQRRHDDLQRQAAQVRVGRVPRVAAVPDVCCVNRAAAARVPGRLVCLPKAQAQDAPLCPSPRLRWLFLPCSEKLDVVRLTFYTAPVSLVCLAPFFWIYEVRRRSAPGQASQGLPPFYGTAG